MISIEGLSDEKEFDTVRRSMTTLQYQGDNEMNTLRAVAAVLHLSNVEFGAQADASGEEGSKVRRSSDGVPQERGLALFATRE